MQKGFTYNVLMLLYNMLKLNKTNGEKKMTNGQVIQKMNGKTFYSESFGSEIVTVSGIEVVGESGLLNLISSPADVKDLYEDFKLTLTK